MITSDEKLVVSALKAGKLNGRALILAYLFYDETSGEAMYGIVAAGDDLDEAMLEQQQYPMMKPLWGSQGDCPSITSFGRKWLNSVTSWLTPFGKDIVTESDSEYERVSVALFNGASFDIDLYVYKVAKGKKNSSEGSAARVSLTPVKACRLAARLLEAAQMAEELSRKRR